MTFGFLSHLDLNLYLFRLPIMKDLVAKGHKVYAICPEGEVFNKFKEEGIEAISYEIKRESTNPFLELKAIYNIYKVLKPLKIEILHTFTAKPNIYGSLAGKLVGIKVIINLVEGLGSFYTNNSMKSKLMRFVIEFGYKNIFKLSQSCVFVNNEDLLYLKSKGVISEDKAVLIRSVGVDTAYFDISTIHKQDLIDLKDELGLGAQFIVLMIARAIYDKGIQELYDSAKELKDEDIQYVLVGDTDEGNPSCISKQYLQSGHVLWLGHRDDIKELIGLSNIVVLPSYREGIPRTLLEASSMQKAIITTDATGCREVVHDKENGYLIPTHNAAALSTRVLELSKDFQLCQNMGENGRNKMLENFDIHKVVEQYLRLYKRFKNV